MFLEILTIYFVASVPARGLGDKAELCSWCGDELLQMDLLWQVIDQPDRQRHQKQGCLCIFRTDAVPAVSHSQRCEGVFDRTCSTLNRRDWRLRQQASENEPFLVEINLLAIYAMAPFHLLALQFVCEPMYVHSLT